MNRRRQYYDYLTEIERGKENPVIRFVTELLRNGKYKTKPQIDIADFGCFNGGMLNQIYQLIPRGMQKRIRLYGYDNDSSVLKIGRKMFSHITFSNLDIRDNPVINQSHDLIIISNILHEVYSTEVKSHSKGIETVLKSLRKIGDTLTPKGDLIFLDGLKPSESQKIVTVTFSDNEQLADLYLLKASNYRSPISFTKNEDGSINISLLDLGTYLTKAKYLHRDFWESEARQIYQYFTFDEYQTILNKCGFRVLQSIPQPPNIGSNLTITNPIGIMLPAKSILIYAQKI